MNIIKKTQQQRQCFQDLYHEAAQWQISTTSINLITLASIEAPKCNTPKKQRKKKKKEKKFNQHSLPIRQQSQTLIVKAKIGHWIDFLYINESDWFKRVQ